MNLKYKHLERALRGGTVFVREPGNTRQEMRASVPTRGDHMRAARHANKLKRAKRAKARKLAAVRP